MFATQPQATAPVQNDLPSLAQVMSGGVPSALQRDDPIGTSVTGIVRGIEAQQQHDIDTGAPKFFDNGQPMMQIVVRLATETRDPAIPGDDGVRALYIKGKNITALRNACRKAGRDMPHVGDRMTATYAADGQARKRGWNPPKLHAYELVPSAADVAKAMNQTMPQAQPASTPAPAAAPAPMPRVDATQIRQLAATGRSADQIASFLGLDPRDVDAALEPEF